MKKAVFVAMAVVLLAGCTATPGQEIDVQEFAQSIPALQQLLDENPNAEITAIYLDSAGVQNDSDFDAFCTGTKIQEYYKITIRDSDLQRKTIAFLTGDGITACINTAPETTILTSNIKAIEKYASKEVFLISDVDWRETLPLVPVTTWTGEEDCQQGHGTPANVCVYPTLIYHAEEGTFDADSIILFLQQYGPERITLVGQTPPELEALLTADAPFGGAVPQENIQKIQPADYFSYWKSSTDIVLTQNDYEHALLAATYASLINAPLVIEGTAQDTEGTFSGKNVICIGNVTHACTITYSLEQAQDEYIEKTGADKVILINPQDWSSYLDEPFEPEKTQQPINKLYGKTSLAAPILASAKHEVIASFATDPAAITNQNIGNIVADIDGFLETFFNRLPSYEYLTIVASHLAIPESIGDYYKDVVDWQYAAQGALDDSTKVGRILGITSSDTSSYMARSIFYDQLFENLYPNSRFEALAIGHARPQYARDTEKVIAYAEQAGYTGTCYMDETSAVCEQGTRAPLQNYDKKQIITFADHGSYRGWYSTLSSDEIPDLSLPFTISKACSVTDLAEGGGKTFGANILRKGAIANSGGAGLTPALPGKCSEKNDIICMTDYDCIHKEKSNPKLYNTKISFMVPEGSKRRLYLYDMETEEETPVTPNSANIEIYDMYENKIVWVDNTQIYLYDLPSNTSTVIPTPDTTQDEINKIEKRVRGIIINDKYIAWLITKIDATNERVTTAIHVYNWNTNTFVSLPDEQDPVDIHDSFDLYGNTIAWVDNRNATAGERAIYLFDLETGEETRIEDSATTNLIYSVNVHGNKVLWTEDTKNHKNNMYLYDLDSNTKITVGSDEAYSIYRPKMDDTRIFWNGWGKNNNNSERGLYQYDIAAGGTETMIMNRTNSYAPFGYFSLFGNTLIWTEYSTDDIILYDLTNQTLSAVPINSDNGVCTSELLPGSATAKFVSENPGISLGELYSKLATDPWLNEQNTFKYYEKHLFLGDPTLVPRWAQ